MFGYLCEIFPRPVAIAIIIAWYVFLLLLVFALTGTPDAGLRYLEI